MKSTLLNPAGLKLKNRSKKYLVVFNPYGDYSVSFKKVFNSRLLAKKYMNSFRIQGEKVDSSDWDSIEEIR